MSLKKALLAATVLALPMTAEAQQVRGLYVGAGAGVNWLMESDVELGGRQFTNNFTNQGRNGNIETSLGWGGVVSLGYGFGNGVRAEIEGSYRENEVDDITGFGAGAIPGRRVDGTIRSYGVMANALYDFDLGPGSFVMPYIGVGAGYIWQDYDGVRLAAPAALGGDALIIDGSDGRFAYQAIVGAAFPIRPVPGLAITAEYRFLGTLNPEVDARLVEGGVGGQTFRGNAEVNNYNHSLMVGVRYAFGQTPPPPPVVAPSAPAPAAAAPAPARSFLVFFDFNRADLNDRARQIIGEAAQNAQRGTGTTRIEVSGHADRSGTPQYNQRLSERRAQAVAAELERRGIPRNQMTIQAFGESRPLVPTADGVREPQNRRVEIVLR